MRDLCVIKSGVVRMKTGPRPSSARRRRQRRRDGRPRPMTTGRAGEAASSDGGAGGGGAGGGGPQLVEDNIYVEEPAGMWIVQRNWKDAIDKVDARAAPRGSELLVGVLGSGQVFGEVSVLDANQLSPVTVIAYTNVEMYAISKEHLHAQHASFNVAMNNFLNESMMMHNPPQQKIAQYSATGCGGSATRPRSSAI